MSSDFIDALVYTSIKNNVTDPEILSGFSSFSGGSGATITQRDVLLNGILDQTTIKRACCLGRATPDSEISAAISSNRTHQGIDVKIPMPKVVNLEEYPNKDLFKRLKYFTKKVYIPQSECTRLGYSTIPSQIDKCDNFYKLYCANALNFYKKEVNTNIVNNEATQDEFSKYYPDCSCYGIPPDVPGAAESPPRCTMKNCGNQTGSYLDPNSRTGACSTVFCSQNLEILAQNVMGNVNVDRTQFQSECQIGDDEVVKIRQKQENIETQEFYANAIRELERRNQSGTNTNNNTDTNTNNNTDTNTDTNTDKSSEEESFLKKPIFFIILFGILFFIFIIIIFMFSGGDDYDEYYENEYE
jgi:hypothetical protein